MRIRCNFYINYKDNERKKDILQQDYIDFANDFHSRCNFSKNGKFIFNNYIDTSLNYMYRCNFPKFMKI